MKPNEVTIDQLVTFAILMQAGEGILDKAPHYIIEKFDSCMSFNDPQFLEGLLDSPNLYKLKQWRQRWT